MSDDKSVYLLQEGSDQRESWETTLKGLIQAGRPDDKVLFGSAAANQVQPVLDGFYTKVNEMFDDNNELGQLISSVMAGHHENKRLADQAGVEAVGTEGT